MFGLVSDVLVARNSLLQLICDYIDVYRSAMAKSRESSVQDKIAEVTECSICAEIFTNPKILPCVHTFCLHCLENYGKDKKPGDQMVCPICRNEFIIPEGGLCNLPNNFFIGKMVEIGKLAMAPANETVCDLCAEGKELVDKMYCIDCEQILCDRCSKFHRKIKFCQNHQIVELGSKLNAHNFNLRNSYCDHHPKELVKLYCYDDNVAICVLCCVESHQSHRCVNVDKAAEDFTVRLKLDLKNVTNRLPESENLKEKLDKYKKEFTEQISKTEESIRCIGTKLKALIDEHTDILIQNLKSVRELNLKAVEITRLDVDRFRVMIDSYARYSDELLSRGSPVDICRAVPHMHIRATELKKLPSNCSGGQFHCDGVAFQPSSIETILRQCRSNNIVGELTVTKSPDRFIEFKIESTGRNSGESSDQISDDGATSLASADKGSAKCADDVSTESDSSVVRNRSRPQVAEQPSSSCKIQSQSTKEERIQILATCPTKRIGLRDECPSVRGCPNCGFLIEHQGMIVGMNCSNCQCRFCCICLRGLKQDKIHFICSLAPRQTSLPGSG